MMLFIALFSIFWIIYSLYSLHHFYIRIHQQVYQDYSEIISENINFNEFIEKSSFKPFSFVGYQVVLSYLIVSLPFGYLPGFNSTTAIYYAVVLILLHLSWLDYAYCLTDIKMVAWIFILGVIKIVIADNAFSNEYLHTFLFALFFLYIISRAMTLIFRKSCLGEGDVLLLSALALFFFLDEYWILLFGASLFGLIFALVCRVIKKPVVKIPFIPFISLSFYLLFLYNCRNF